MDDLISRQAAIEKISETIWDTAVANDVKTTLKELPSAQPVRHGKWLPKHHYIAGYEFVSGHICSECGNDALNAEGDDFLTDYCPNCGALMDGEVEGKKK